MRGGGGGGTGNFIHSKNSFKLNFRQKPKTLLPKSFLQFETPKSLVLALSPLPQSPQKFNSINAPYIEVTIPKLSQK